MFYKKKEFTEILNRLITNDPTLVTLNLDIGDIEDRKAKISYTNEDIEKLASALVSNTHLHSLNLYYNLISRASVIKLLKVCKVKQLQIGNIHFLTSDENGKEFGRAIANNQHLEYLDMGNTAIDDEVLSELANSQSIKYLSIQQNPRISSVGIANLLTKNRVLETFKLALNSQLGFEGIKQFAAYLKETSLKSVNFSGNNIRSEGLEVLAKSLQENHAKLNKLIEINLSNNQLYKDVNDKEEPQGIKVLSEVFGKNNHLQIINLELNAIGDEGAINLFNGLKFDKSVREMYLNNNLITGNGIQNLPKMLKQNTALKTLRLHCNPLNSQGINFVANALRDNTSLESLTIGRSYNIFDLAMVHAIENLTESLTKSRVLKFDFSDSFNEYSLGAYATKVAMHFAAMIKNKNLFLEHLNLSHNNFDIEGMLVLTSALKENIVLQSLSIGGNAFNKNIVENLAAALKSKGNRLKNLDIREWSFTKNQLPYSHPVDVDILNILLAALEENYQIEIFRFNNIDLKITENAQRITERNVKIKTSKLPSNILKNQPIEKIEQFNVALYQELSQYKKILARYLLKEENHQLLNFDYHKKFNIGGFEFTATFTAALFGDKELLELLDKQGQLNFNNLSSSSENLLYYAVVNNHIEVIEYLLNKSPELIFRTNNSGETPLHYAAHYGHADLAAFLIDNGADFTLKNNARETPGDVARKAGHGDLSQWLYQKELISACYTNNLEEIKRVAPLLGDNLVNTVDKQGNNPLMIMLLKSNQEAVMYFLEKTPGLHNKVIQELRHAKNNQGNTIIHLASMLPNTKGFNFLSYIIKEPDLYSYFNAKNKMDQTPLDVAVEQHQYVNVRILIPYFDESHKTLYASSSFNVIERCVASGDIACLEVFVNAKKTIAKGALWNLDKKLLWIAVEFNRLPVLAYLLNLEGHHFLDDAQRQRLTVGEQENLFLLNYAAWLGRTDIIEMLVRRYKINFAHTTKEKSALHWAIEGAHLETVKVILALDKSLVNQAFERIGSSERAEYVTPLNYAIELNQKEIINTLNYVINEHSTNQVFQEELEKPETPKNLVFQGGGAKGLAHMGALHNLATRLNGLDEIARVAGTSAGAITAALLAVGYTLDELEKELSQKNFADFLDLANLNVPQKNTFAEWGKSLFGYAKCVYDSRGVGLGLVSCAVSKTIEQGGLCTGEAFLQWMEEMVYNKTKIHHFTLGDLADGMNRGKGYKHLSIVTVKVGKDKTEGKVFSSEEKKEEVLIHRDVILSDLVRMSMSIPGVFQPHYLYQRVTSSDSGKKERIKISVEGEYYIDGGLFLNYPLEIFDYQKFQLGSLAKDHPLYNPETLGFALLDDSVKNPDDQEKNLSEWLGSKLKDEIKTRIDEKQLIKLIGDLFSAYYQHESISRSFKPQSSYEARTVSIRCNVGMLDFGMTLEQKKELLRRGDEAVNEFYSNSLNPGENYAGHTPTGSAWPLPGVETRELRQHNTMLLEDELEEANDEIIEAEELQVSSAVRLSSPWSSLFVLPMALMHGAQLFVPPFSSVESQHEQGKFEGHFETRQYDETIPDYHSSATEQLMLLHWGMQYISSWLPSNQVRELTDTEAAELREHQRNLVISYEKLNEFNKNIIANCGLFDDQLNWLNNNIKVVKLKIHSVLNKGQITQAQWNELIHKMTNIENELTNLGIMQEELLVIEAESAKLAAEGNRYAIGYDFIQHKLKITIEAIELDKAPIQLSSWELLPSNSLFAHKQQFWAQAQSPVFEELSQHTGVRKLTK